MSAHLISDKELSSPDSEEIKELGLQEVKKMSRKRANQFRKIEIGEVKVSSKDLQMNFFDTK